jgi:anaerobic sulfite reductase subunit A
LTTSAAEEPMLSFGGLAQLFVDRRDVKFWQTEGAQHNYLYWVRAMISKEAEPVPLTPRPVTMPSTVQGRLRFAQARQQVYGFLSRAFEYPDDAFLTDITTPACFEGLAEEFRLLAGNDDVDAGLYTWQRLVHRGVPLIAEFGISPLREAYTRMIYDSNLPCIPPYESVYAHERQVMGKHAGAVDDYYRRTGLGVEGSEMPDHIALECEFVAYLAGREAEARESGQNEQADAIWDTARRFLSDHLLSWGGKFCADLLFLADVEFYHALGKLGAGLFNDELLRVQSET